MSICLMNFFHLYFFSIFLYATSTTDIYTLSLHDALPILQTLDEKLANIAGAEITVSEMDAGIGMGDPIQINLNGPEHEVLRELADDIATGIQGIDGVFNPESEAALGVPQLQLEVDKEIAALHGLTVDDIQSKIDMRFIGQIVTIYREEGRDKIGRAS